MIYFYARVSSKDQNLDRQLEAAKSFKNIDKVFADMQSGKNFDRPEYIKLKDSVQSGDEIIIKELDRLGRNKEGIKEEIKWFKDRGVVLRILDVPTTLIDFQGQDWIADMVNNILIEVLGAIAQNERERTRKRQREGIDIALSKGIKFGRPNKETNGYDKIMKQVEDGRMKVMEACAELGISKTQWYRLKSAQ